MKGLIERRCRVGSSRSQFSLFSLLIATVCVLTLVAACYDHYRIPASELLLSFSLKRNAQKLTSLERPQGDIASLHGIRFFNSLMLIVSHKSMAIFYDPYINRTYMSEVRCDITSVCNSEFTFCSGAHYVLVHSPIEKRNLFSVSLLITRVISVRT